MKQLTKSRIKVINDTIITYRTMVFLCVKQDTEMINTVVGKRLFKSDSTLNVFHNPIADHRYDYESILNDLEQFKKGELSIRVWDNGKLLYEKLI